jgi:hypothetical protein
MVGCSWKWGKWNERAKGGDEVSDYFWPSADEAGFYTVIFGDGVAYKWLWDGSLWRDDVNTRTTQHMIHVGYLGVRREPAAKIANATPKPSKALTPDPDDANLAYAASVMVRLRAAKKPGEFERIALECVPNLCQMLGAE